MSIPKGHHVLPEKAYLNGFTTDGLLWVFDRITKKFLNLPPRVTTVRNDYYSFVDTLGNKDTTIENPVLSGVEAATIPVIQKLEDRQEISLDDRMVLSLFVALMFLRTPAFERMHNKIGEELHRFRNRFIFNSPEKVQKMLDALPESVRSTDLATAKEIFKFAQQGEYNVKFHRNASLEMMLEFAVEFTPIFAKLNWIIGHTPATARFVTTDAPFVISPPPGRQSKLGLGRGILVRGATKAIALSQRLCLSMGDPGDFFGHLDLQNDGVKKNNLAFASRAERFIISPNELLLKNIVTTLNFEK
jgi:hypothetical protein